MMDVLLQENKPILFTGESGVGKTSLTVPHLFHLKNSSISTVFLNFSAKTKPKDTQFAI
jgi:DNA replication protein DnaC